MVHLGNQETRKEKWTSFTSEHFGNGVGKYAVEETDSNTVVFFSSSSVSTFHPHLHLRSPQTTTSHKKEGAIKGVQIMPRWK
ncbi:hypothetical protein JTE90_009704 [Oedothorax gibbosus]|uniref:Uncharacterized protein n=1 Tax=Oedothorax gibbosus TaxID=931172 RepID=A0AAV6VAI4_9ARAC|nr:hypothetical protein JTE90_009704 [Oedothorax gibbosus]